VVVVLDTNHFRELVEDGSLGRRLLARIDQQGADVFTCIVAVEETLRGWLSLLSREPPGHDQLRAYLELKRSLEVIANFTILPFDTEAADCFVLLRKQLPRAGTMDLKVAAICIAHGVVLLSRNLRDFEQIPGLRVENWLD
jgi:tRNA(fMet)-specific endonuclease VapC